MTLELRLFGGLELADATGRPIEVSAKKARALLAYLAAQPGRRHAREQVAALLWGDVSADEHARRSLRQALSVLRKALPAGVLEAGRDELGVAEAGARADVRAFQAGIEGGDRESLRRAVALYRGDFLEGFSARADGFDEWAGRERTRLRELAIEAMERLGRLERDAGQLEAAVTLAMRVVALEPLRESAHRDLMQLYVAANAPGRALKQYDTCHKLLARELGIAPSPATAALSARIRAGETGDLAAPAPLADPPPLAPEVTAGPTLRHVVVVHVVTALPAYRRRRRRGRSPRAVGTGAIVGAAVLQGSRIDPGHVDAADLLPRRQDPRGDPRALSRRRTLRAHGPPAEDGPTARSPARTNLGNPARTRRRRLQNCSCCGSRQCMPRVSDHLNKPASAPRAMRPSQSSSDGDTMVRAESSRAHSMIFRHPVSVTGAHVLGRRQERGVPSGRRSCGGALHPVGQAHKGGQGDRAPLGRHRRGPGDRRRMGMHRRTSRQLDELVASATKPADVRRELRRGLAALDAGAVAHGRILFLTHALLATIRLRDAHETRRLADMLTRSTEEPCELVTLFVDLGRASTAVLAAPGDGEPRAQLGAVAKQSREAGLAPLVQLIAEI